MIFEARQIFVDLVVFVAVVVVGFLCHCCLNFLVLIYLHFYYNFLLTICFN
jgi:hypothetical protein